MIHFGVSISNPDAKYLTRENYIDLSKPGVMENSFAPGTPMLGVPNDTAMAKRNHVRDCDVVPDITDTELVCERYYLGYALRENRRKFDMQTANLIYWEKEGRHIFEKIRLLKDFKKVMSEMPRAWQGIETYSEYRIPADKTVWTVTDIDGGLFSKQADIKSDADRMLGYRIIDAFGPYHSPAYAVSQSAKVLENFDKNMQYFESLDEEEFHLSLLAMLHKYPLMREATTMAELVGVPGLYVMVLDKYKQVYIGITASKLGIKSRVSQHWSAVHPLDRLIFGSVDTSIMTIDAFKRLDMTRIFYIPMSITDARCVSETGRVVSPELRNLEFKAVESAMPQKFLLNRCSGGGISLADAIETRKSRDLT